MAHFVTSVRTSRTLEETFIYMADLRNFADWDPGVRSVTQVAGLGGGEGATFDVVVKGFAGDLTLRYATTDFSPPDRVRVHARSRLLTSTDTIEVTGVEGGCVVVYDADLRFNGLLGLLDVGLRRPFRRIGERAAEGLRRALDGEFV